MRLLSKILVFLIVGTSVTLKLSDKNFGKNGNYGAIDWDNFGYYLYLPSIFIYDDLKLQNDSRIINIQEKYHLSSNYYQAHKIHNGNRVIQYTSGMALLYSPAFFSAHLIAKITPSFDADGFSPPYQIAVLIESFLILFLGLFYLRRFLLFLFSEKVVCMMLIIVGFGTNFLQIASINVSSPHLYLFASYSIVLFYTHKWHQSPRLKYLLIVSSLIALMSLIRPNELLFGMVPLFWTGGTFNSLKEKLQYLFSKPIHYTAIIPFVVLGIIQPIYWHYVTGEWIFDTYINEDFKLFDPYLKEFLFSYKKGWLLYTPVMAFAILGLISFYKDLPKIALPSTAFILVNIWILSSWDCWWYAGSFGQRSIVQAYPILLLPIGYLIKYSIDRSKILFSSLSIALLVLTLFNLFQTYQFQSGILHGSRMTKEFYHVTFLDTEIEKEDQKYLEHPRDIQYIIESENLNRFVLYKEEYSILQTDSFKFNNNFYSHEGELKLENDHKYSEAFKFSYQDFCDTSYAYFIGRIRFKSNYEAKENPFGIRAQMIDARSGKIYKSIYRGVEHISWFEKGSWSSMDLVFIPPYLRSRHDSISIFIELQGDKSIEIDQFSVEILDPSINPKVKNRNLINDYHTLTVGNWTSPKALTSVRNYERIDSLAPYSSTLTEKVGNLKGREITLTLNGLSTNSDSDNIFAVISTQEKDNENTSYSSFKVNTSLKWEDQSFTFEIPREVSDSNFLKAYVWNKGKTTYFIDNLSIKTK